jgi:hypothetical protein
LDGVGGEGLRDWVWNAVSGIFKPAEVGAGIEAIACAVAKAMKAARDRSAACLFIGEYDLPERRICYSLQYRLSEQSCTVLALSDEWRDAGGIRKPESGDRRFDGMQKQDLRVSPLRG